MPLSDSEWYYSFTAGNVCAECAERLDTEDLIRLAGLRSRGEMLSLLGGERRR